MKNIKNYILALCCGLILIGCNSGSSSPSNGGGTPVNPTLRAPTVSSNIPNNATDVSITTPITLTFSEAVSGVTNSSVIQLRNIIDTVPQKVNITQSGNSYNIVYTGPLSPVAQYLVIVNPGITSIATGLPVIPTQFNFTTSPERAVLADFTFTPTSPTTADNVTFTDTTTNPVPTGWNWTISPPTGWSFTNNTSATSQNPQITFTTAITYTVTNAPTGSGVIYSVATKRVIVKASAKGLLTSISSIRTESLPQVITISPSLTGISNVYVANRNSNSISQYSRNSNGKLTALIPATVTTESPSGITISPDGNNVYVTNAGGNTVSICSRDISLGTGQLSCNYFVPTGSNPRGISISLTGNYVYVTNSGDGTVWQYVRSLNGLLVFKDIVKTESRPSDIISPDDLNVYVVNNGSNTVSQYSIVTGKLTFVESVPTGIFPRGISISPNGLNVYVANSGEDTVSQYSRNISTGKLTSIGTVKTSTTPHLISISPDGLNVYVTDIGNDTVSQYSRSADGLLNSIGTVATGIFPSGISISPDGNYVYVTNAGSDTVSQYSRK